MSTRGAPAGLGDRGRALWEALSGRVAGDWEQQELLTEASRVADRLDELEAEARSLGPVVTGWRGQPVRNPLVDQQTALQGTYSRLLRKLTVARGARPAPPLIEAPARLARFDPADWPGLSDRDAREACYRARVAFIDAAEAPTTLGDFVDVLRQQMWERGGCGSRDVPRPVPWGDREVPSAEEYRAERLEMRSRRAAAERRRDGERWGSVRDTEVAGVVIPAGAQVFALIGSADRDPGAFGEPDRFDLGRADADRHLAFGRGIHFCVGSGLARAEARIALTGLAARLPGLRLPAGFRPPYLPNLLHRGPTTLPVSW